MQEMIAAVYTQYGSVENLRLTHVPAPVPKENEVLVKVRASSINSWDWDLVRGNFVIIRLIGGLFTPRHKILGADIAGEVVACGKNAKDFREGDQVFGDIAGAGFGGFAEYVSVPEKLLARKSPAMSFEQAAALPQAGLLALQGLRYKGEISAGQQVLINGAGGGVGTWGLQYAKSRGAEVTCVDRSEKFETLKNLGADHLLDYREHDYTRTGKTYHKILDVIAHRKPRDYRRALQPGGIFVMIGGSMGALLLQLMIIGPLLSLFGNRKLALMGYRPNRSDLDLLSRLFEEGKCKPVIDRTYTLSELTIAFRHFATGMVKGKLIIAPMN